MAIHKVLVTGGAGYVGAVLVPRLLAAGYAVRVLDLYLYGEDVLRAVRNDSRLEQVRGDLRDVDLLRQSLSGCDGVIHLACISNDPSFDLDPALGRSINYDAFGPLVELSRQAGVRRFIYASSSSVYGVSDQPHVTEEHPLRPLTDYSRYKALCEPILLESGTAEFVPIVVRPATLCGYSPRQRLDLTVNILTNHAIHKNRITVFGGSQLRPNYHVEDMAELYVRLLSAPEELVAGQTFNAGYQNARVADLATLVRGVVERELPERPAVPIDTAPSDDLRSYHISSEKLQRVLGYRPGRSIADAVRDLARAFSAGWLPRPLDDSAYYNIRRMQEVRLQ